MLKCWCLWRQPHRVCLLCRSGSQQQPPQECTLCCSTCLPCCLRKLAGSWPCLTARADIGRPQCPETAPDSALLACRSTCCRGRPRCREWPGSGWPGRRACTHAAPSLATNCASLPAVCNCTCAPTCRLRPLQRLPHPVPADMAWHGRTLPVASSMSVFCDIHAATAVAAAPRASIAQVSSVCASCMQLHRPL